MPPPALRVLVVNPGSSSRRFALFQADEAVLESHYETTGDGFAVHHRATDGSSDEPIDEEQFDRALDHFLAELTARGFVSNPGEIDAIGVRAVAPGRFFLAHHLVDDEVRGQIHAARTRAR